MFTYKKLFTLILILFVTVSLSARTREYYNPYSRYYTKKHKVKKKRTLRKKIVKRRVKKKDLRKKIIRKKRKKVYPIKIQRRKYHVLFNKAGFYYSGIEIGQTSLSRAVTLNSKDLGGKDLTSTEDGRVIGKADGKTYSFNESISYSRLALDIGFQEAKSGDFYQLSWYSNDYVQDLLATLGFSYKRFGYRYLYGTIPFLKIDLGFGHTGTTNGMPTNYTYGVGAGVYKNINKFHLKTGIGYQKRNWAYIDKDIGTEKWEDSEITMYVGVAYLF